MLISATQAPDGCISSTNTSLIRPQSSLLRHTHSNSMPIISNDPSWWPLINASRISNYFTVAASVGVMYDWALTFGQEIELVWKQRWSPMTIMYLSVRYLGLLSVIIQILYDVPIISITDVVSRILYVAQELRVIVVFPILCVIMITRLHAMYQRSRKMLIFLVVIFVAGIIFSETVGVIAVTDISEEQLILSNTYQCTMVYAEYTLLLISVAWMLGTVWEVLVLCLAVWIAVKHFRELRQHSSGGLIGDCFTVLVKTHVVYFMSWVVVAFFGLGCAYSVPPGDTLSVKFVIYNAALEICQLVQMFVMGPRLILGVREYHAKLVADSNAATDMTSIAFQGRVHVSTSSSV